MLNNEGVADYRRNGAIATGKTALHEQDFTIVANGSTQIDVTGDYFRFTEMTGRVLVTLSTGGSLRCRVGQGLKNKAFTRLTLKDISGLGSVGKMLVGWGAEFLDQQSYGSLDINGVVPVAGKLPVVLDQALQISGNPQVILAGVPTINGTYASYSTEYLRAFQSQAFIGHAVTGGAAAGKSPSTQLWNPPTSIKTVVLNKVSLWAGVSDTIWLYAGNNAAPLPQGNNFAPVNKFKGLVAANALLLTDITNQSFSAGFIRSMPPSPINTLQTIVFDDPIVLPPGFGCVVAVSNPTPAALHVTYEFLEV